MVRIKICGITNLEDALLAADLGAQALGFIFASGSSRKVSPETAREIIRQLPPFILSVGVFVDEEAGVVRELAARVGLDWVQLHGRESPEYCGSLGRRVLKAIPIQDEASLGALRLYQGAAQAFLLDTYRAGQAGGTGLAFDWELAARAREYGPIVLAGGLTAENVAEAIKIGRPQAVDVSSGVETVPGKKDPQKLRAFFKAVASGQ
jgi:phosphoribosylanthranilate isomerase